MLRAPHCNSNASIVAGIYPVDARSTTLPMARFRQCTSIGCVSYSPCAKRTPLMDPSRPLRRFIHIMAVGTVLCVASPATAQAPFHLEEATISTIRAAFANGQLTCAQLTKLYLDRINAYNLKGPALHAIITVNPLA